MIRIIVFLCLTLCLASARADSNIGISFIIESKLNLDKSQLDGAVVFLSSDSKKPEMPFLGTKALGTKALGTKALEAKAFGATTEVIQKDLQFKPYIKAIAQGETVRFPNKDPVAHHVYSFSAAKPFELPLYKGDSGNVPQVLMDKAGVVTIGCNVHDWMVGYIFVSPSPYYAQVKDLQTTIKPVPRGNYRLGMWHPGLDPRETINLPITLEDKSQSIRLKIEHPIKSLPQPTAPKEQFDEMDSY